jgi:sterol desaturase/sphingolipid hydroxylase (fatty acid hydroxylase superfamily)
MDKETLSNNLWSTANLITGFAIIQTITFSYTCAKPDFALIINTVAVKLTISISLVFMTIIQSYAVLWCSKKQIILLEQYPPLNMNEQNSNSIIKIIKQSAYGRIFLIVLLLIPSLLALYAKQLGGLPYN